MMESKIVYFEKPGVENTDQVLQIAKQRAKELGIKAIVLASHSGKTGVKAVNALKGLRVIIVTHSVGFRGPNADEFQAQNRKIIEENGGVVHTATHVFGGINRAMRQGNIPQCAETYVVGDIAATTLKCFGQGMKVCVEIAAMAADAGLIPTGEEIISIAGTGAGGGGCDTAVVMTPANAHSLFDTRINEILCKPRLSLVSNVGGVSCTAL
jgi:uncharacterized protein